MFRKALLRCNMLNIAPRSKLVKTPRFDPLGDAGNKLLVCGMTTESKVPPQAKTVDKEEIDRFSQLSDTWWNEKSNFASLHTMNKLRIPLIKGCVDSSAANPTTPLLGTSVLDVGCGGGILSEPMARLGASVVGLDASEDGIKAAIQRKETLREPILDRNLQYHCGTVEEFVTGREATFDLIVASEVVEHVSSVDSFIKSCVQLIKPGGSMVVTTINRTQLSYWLTIVAAENILNLVEKGTHSWDKYVEPKLLQQIFHKYGCRQTLLHGMCLNVLTLSWSWTENTDMNYAATFVKDQS